MISDTSTTDNFHNQNHQSTICLIYGPGDTFGDWQVHQQSFVLSKFFFESIFFFTGNIFFFQIEIEFSSVYPNVVLKSHELYCTEGRDTFHWAETHLKPYKIGMKYKSCSVLYLLNYGQTWDDSHFPLPCYFFSLKHKLLVSTLFIWSSLL